MKKKIAFFSVLLSNTTMASEALTSSDLPKEALTRRESSLQPRRCPREQLREFVDDLTSQGPQVSPLEGSPEERLFKALTNFHRELIFLKVRLQDTVPSSSNQFCPVHGNLEDSPIETFHSSSASLPKNKIVLKKLTNEKQLPDWVKASPTPEIRQKRAIIAETLRTLGFSREVKGLLEGIFEFTWHCSIKS